MVKANIYDDIAVIGIGIRASKCSNKNDFVRIIENNINCVSAFPLSRYIDVECYYTVTNQTCPDLKKIHGAFFHDIDKFAYAPFGISRIEACLMDPAQRLLLDTAKSALYDAGYMSKHINDSNTGVFVGNTPVSPKFRELISLISTANNDIAYLANISSALAGRISYLFNLKGPSLVVNSEYNSSLRAMQLAGCSLQNHECDLAMAGGVVLNLFPEERDTNKMIGESACIVILQRLSDAIDANNHIYSTLGDYYQNHENDALDLYDLGCHDNSQGAQKLCKRDADLIKNWGDLCGNTGIINAIKKFLHIERKTYENQYRVSESRMILNSRTNQSGLALNRGAMNRKNDFANEIKHSKSLLINDDYLIEKSNVFTLSARNKAELLRLVRDILNDENINEQFGNVCYSVNVLREHYNYRLAILCTNTLELKYCLFNMLYGNVLDNVFLTDTPYDINIGVENDRVRKLVAMSIKYVEGHTVKWSDIYQQKMSYVSLPDVDTIKERCWIDSEISKANNCIDGNVLQTKWVNMPPAQVGVEPLLLNSVIVFCSKKNEINDLCQGLYERFSRVIIVELGDAFCIFNEDHYIITNTYNDYLKLFEQIRIYNVDCIVYALTLNTKIEYKNIENNYCNLDIWVYSLFYIYKIIFRYAISIIILTKNAVGINEYDTVCAETSEIVSFVNNLCLEKHNIKLRYIDIDDDFQYQYFFYELDNTNDFFTAYRGNYRYIPEYHSAPLKTLITKYETAICTNGTYMIIGELSSIELEISEYLSENNKVNIIIIGSKVFNKKDMHGIDKGDFNPKTMMLFDKIEAAGSHLYYYNYKDIAFNEMCEQIIEKHGKVDCIFECCTDRYIIPMANIDAKKLKTQILVWWQKKSIVESIISVLKPSLVAFFKFGGDTKKHSYFPITGYYNAYSHYRNVEFGRTICVSIVGDNIEKSNSLHDIISTSIVLSLNTNLSNAILSIADFENNPALKLRIPDVEDNESSTFLVKQKKDIVDNSIECSIVCAWQEASGLNKVEYDSNYSNLFSSASIIQKLIDKINKKLGIRISTREFYNYPTINKMVQYVKKNFLFLSVIPRIESTDSCYYPMSNSQRELFAAYIIEPQGTMFNLSTAITIRGILDENKLVAAFDQLVNRHAILRTTFHIRNSSYMQYVHEKAHVSIERHLLDRNQIREFIYSNIKPFELEKLPLFRVFLGKIALDEWLLMYDMHHIISDGVSSEIITNELIDIYNGAILSPPKIQYVDYAGWQDHIHKMVDMSEQERYWCSMYNGFQEANHVNMEEKNIINHVFSLSSKMNLTLRKYAKKNNLSIVSILFAGYALLYYYFREETDFIIGFPITGRSNPELESTVGVFVNVLPIRVTVNIEDNVSRFIFDIHSKLYSSIENQLYCALGCINNKLKNIVGKPMYTATFSMQNWLKTKYSVEKLTIEKINIEKRNLTNDLMLYIDDLKNEIAIGIDYNKNFISANSPIVVESVYTRILENITDYSNSELKNIANSLKESGRD